MPQAIPIAAAIGASAASAGAIAAGTVGFLGLSATAWTAIGLGISITGTLASTLLAEQPPKPKMQEGNLTTKQPIPSRTRGYGRVRSGGEALYDDSTSDGDLNRLLHHVSHLIAEFEERWLADDRVQIDEDGNVLDDPWWQEDDLGGGGDSTVVLVEYKGEAGQVVDTIPNPPWTPDHRCAGLCCTRVKFSDLGAEDQARVFPAGPQAYSTVFKAALIYDPRDVAQDFEDEGTFLWSDNGALVVLDFLTRVQIAADGMRVPWGFGIKPQWIDFDSFAAAADDSDDDVPLKDGGVEKRWRSWGKYELTEDRKAVLGDLLDACCGRLLQGPDGRIGLSVGKPDPVAAVTITDDMIKEYDLSAGKSAITRVNEVRVTYVSEAWNFNETEAGIQSDLEAIDRNGLESIKQQLRFVPAESQAQRVAKFLLRKGSPSWQGRIRGKLALLNAWGERWVRLTLAELEIDQIFEVTSIRLIRDADVLEAEMEVTSYDGWFDWNAAADEKDPAEPPPDTDEDGSGVPTPEGVAATIEHRNVNGQGTVAIGVISCDPAPRSVYKAWARYRPVTVPESPWELLAAPQDTWQVKTGPLADNTLHETQMSFTGPRGSRSKWVPRPPPDGTGPVQFTAVADPVAPDAPTAPFVSILGTTAALQSTAPNSSHMAVIRFWRDSDNVFAGAVDVSGPIYTASNSLANYTDTPGPGRWYYWATAENWSGVRSAAAGPTGPEDFVPAAPVITSPTTPYITSDNTPTFSGTAQNGTVVHLYDGATDVGSVAVVAGAWTITASTLADGTRNVTAKAVAGPLTSATSNTVVTTIDTVVSPPVITNSSPINTTDTTPDISGTAEAGAHVDVYRGGSTLAGTATADGSGNWTSTLSTLSIGSYSITAKQTDLAGNVSGASSPAKTLNIQPVAPAITTTSATTYDTTPTIAGTSTASATIKLYDDGVLSATFTADGSGNWSHATGVLATGANVIAATQTVSSIESPASSGITMTVSALDSDAAAIIAAMTTEPTSTRMGLINDLVTSLKTAGIWTKIDRLFILAAADSQASLLDWKSHAAGLTVTAAGSPSTSPTFTADRGWQGGGAGATVGGYLASSFNATVGTNQLAQDSCHLAVWMHAASSGTVTGDYRDAGGGQISIATKNATAVLWCQANAGVANQPTQAGAGTGFYAWSRQASGTYHAYQDTNDLGSISQTSAALTSGAFNILRSGSRYSNGRVAAACWGAGLSGTEVTALRNALNTYLVGVGAA